MNMISSLKELLIINDGFKERYKKNSLIKLVNSEQVEDLNVRERLLDTIQVFSNYFQKVIMLRSVFCDNYSHSIVANHHLVEEFQHNLSLERDRKNRPLIWDPILESTSCWFAWKMFTTNNEEKLVLIHLVLEASANIFFYQANLVMTKYGETKYFSIHNELDESHEKLANKLLEHLSNNQFQNLAIIQSEGWSVLNAACNRIAEIVTKSKL